jgi:hypothetical protein
MVVVGVFYLWPFLCVLEIFEWFDVHKVCQIWQEVWFKELRIRISLLIFALQIKQVAMNQVHWFSSSLEIPFIPRSLLCNRLHAIFLDQLHHLFYLIFDSWRRLHNKDRRMDEITKGGWESMNLVCCHLFYLFSQVKLFQWIVD